MCFTRPRYQVSVYRTIGPLVYILQVMERDSNLMRQEGPFIFAQAKHMKGIEEIADCSSLITEKDHLNS